MRAAPGRTQAFLGCVSRTPYRAALGLGLPGPEEGTGGLESPVIFHFLSCASRVDTAVHGHRRPLPSSMAHARSGAQPSGSLPYPVPTSTHPKSLPAGRRHLPSPLSRTDSLLFCASARFLWRGRSRDSSRARASAPCISPMAADRGARSGRRRPASTDVSLKEPP